MPEAAAEPATPVRLVGALAGAFLASGCLLALAEWMAARGDASAHFYVFWAGYALAVAPAAWCLVKGSSSGAFRGALVVALGTWSLAPILLRTGNRPLFFDEFSHLRMAQDLVRTGRPVSSTGLLQIGANFPGLELATSAIDHLSGLTLWLAALTVAGVAHVALLAGVYVLVRDAARSSRAGAIAAVAYSLNPSWLFFDAQYSYETLALPILVWALVFALRGARSGRSAGARFPRGVQLGLAVVLTAALVVTHHVTSVVNCAALVVIAMVATLQRRGVLTSEVETSPTAAWSLAAVAIALTTARFVAIGRPLVVYLGPTYHLSNELRQLLSLLGIGKGLAVHGAFASSGAPVFERVCAYAMLPVLLVAFVWAVWGLITVRRRISPVVYAGAVLGAFFFISLPLATAATYAEPVHRSWAFSFLGLAIVVAIAAEFALTGELSLRLRRRSIFPPAERVRRALGPVVAACTAVVAIGGVGVGTATSYRFGGKVAPATDPLYVGTQTRMLASWFARHADHAVLFGDRFVVRPIAVASRVIVVPPGDTEALLFLSPSPVPIAALQAYLDDRVTYIVVNRRTGRIRGVTPWFWFVSSDSLIPASARLKAYPQRAACLDWANAVFATTDYEVLKVDRARLQANVTAGTSGLLPGCAAP